jgi:hypothetical protein
MRQNEVERIVTDNPDNAEEELNSFRPTQEEVKYLRFLLEKLRGSEDRTIKEEWKAEFGLAPLRAEAKPSDDEELEYHDNIKKVEPQGKLSDTPSHTTEA